MALTFDETYKLLDDNKTINIDIKKDDNKIVIKNKKTGRWWEIEKIDNNFKYTSYIENEELTSFKIHKYLNKKELAMHILNTTTNVEKDKLIEKILTIIKNNLNDYKDITDCKIEIDELVKNIEDELYKRSYIQSFEEGYNIISEIIIDLLKKTGVKDIDSIEANVKKDILEQIIS